MSHDDHTLSLPLVSVVIPCFNEADGITETHRRITDVLTELDAYEYEIVYVDDGSTDRTPDLLRALQADDPRARVVYLSRNFGHQIAVTAGLANAAGDAAVIMDADLQDPPEVVPEMLARWREGYEVVYGVRTDRDGETRFKLLTARAFYRLMRRLADTEIPMDTGDFRLVDRRVIDAIVAMPERDRFLRGMVSWVGFRQTAVRYHRAPRFAGHTKYPFAKMTRFALDGIASFSLKPLRLSSYAGLLCLALAVAAIAYAVLGRRFTAGPPFGWATLVAALVLGGAQLLVLGIIGEYVGRIYGEAKRRPLYLVRERLGFAESAAGGLYLEQRQQPYAPHDRRRSGERRRGRRDNRNTGRRRSARPA